MDNNYLLQYDQVVAYLEHYVKFWAEILRRYQLVRAKSPFRFFKESRTVLKQVNPLSGRSSENYRNLLAGTATVEDKENPYFQVFMSDYTLEALALAVLKEFPDLDYGKLIRVHEIRKGHLTRSHVLQQSAGIILAAATILLRSIPKSVVERGIDYAGFELIVFLITSMTLVVLLIGFLPVWRRYDSAKRTLGLIGDVLTYINIKQGETHK